MKKFVSGGHRSTLSLAILLSNIFFIAMLFLSILRCKRLDTMLFTTLFTLLVALFTNFSIYRANKCGLYIDGKSFYTQGFWGKKNLNLNDIIAIKIAKSSIKTKFGTRLIKDERGNQMYSAIFVKGSIPNFQPNYNDIDIMIRYRKKVMFKTIYDKEAIDYILTLNPNIRLL